MNVLIIGNGGREHAMAWQTARSSRVTQVFVAPGNAGTALEKKVINVALDPLNFSALIHFAKQHAVAFTLVGPEVPLCAGIVDAFQAAGLSCLGPNKFPAQLEGSKIFSKKFMQQQNIPTAAFAEFHDLNAARDYLQQQTFPVVIKADGLAAGKGVVIAHHLNEGLVALDSMLGQKKFGAASSQIIIEEFINGVEASFIVLTDGNNIITLPSAQDHKTRDDGDHGPNTGGMGAYSPTQLITPVLEQKILRDIITPTIHGMASCGHPYRGFLYAGLMLGRDQTVSVIEFNCRLGDPEAQVILLRLQSDFVELCEAALQQRLGNVTPQWDPRPALGVVLAAKGYPEHADKGVEIHGLNTEVSSDEKIFHAGTAQNGEKIIANGGRVLCVSALGDTLQQAQSRAYQRVAQLNHKDFHYRHDIGYRGLQGSHDEVN